MRKDSGKGKTSKGEGAEGTVQQKAKDEIVPVHSRLALGGGAGRVWGGDGGGSRRDWTGWPRRGRGGGGPEGFVPRTMRWIQDERCQG